jgi:hypothetical protein
MSRELEGGKSISASTTENVDIVRHSLEDR